MPEEETKRPASSSRGSQHMGEERAIMESTESKQTAVHLEAAYSELTKATQETPEYYRALMTFLSLLFLDGKLPISQEPASNLPASLVAAHQIAEESAPMKSSKRP